MPQKGLGLSPRLRYLVGRARRINVGSVVERAKESSAQHDKWTPAIVVDMLWQAGFRNVGFQDYIDYDFAILSRDERATYMTHPVSNQLSQKFDHPDFRYIFQDKVEFDRVFSEHLHRDWMVVEAGNADDVGSVVAEGFEAAVVVGVGEDEEVVDGGGGGLQGADEREGVDGEVGFAAVSCHAGGQGAGRGETIGVDRDVHGASFPMSGQAARR